MKVLESPEMRGNWEREVRMADLYARLAGVARSPATKKQLEQLAADERRHAKAWASYLADRGVAVPR
ncbi:MAG TPA: rubrerythrin family protein, partial [Candidatus Dormibacteraeota bacterium]|nr:rubrerythrin family protein [Candidatus Dormibacteraeota bacterium]